MKLTTYTTYAMRVLQFAAVRAPHLVRVDDVVAVHRLARPHVVKIVHSLGRAGLLETRRGRGGGFQLGKPADQIRLGDVMRLCEGEPDLVECFTPETNTCPLIGICKLTSALQAAADAFTEVLDQTTIADISHNRRDILERFAGAAEWPEIAELPEADDDAPVSLTAVRAERRGAAAGRG
jgi:Rrf2 family nitric oxide-sensitive transcriptional repressor